MNTMVIDKKKYVIVELKEFDKLVEKAASKKPAAHKLILAGRQKTGL